MEIVFPVKAFKNNLVFSSYGETWAYYKLTPYNYDFLSEEEMKRHYNRQKSFFWQNDVTTHLLVTNERQSIVEMGEKFKRSLSGKLKDAAIQHSDSTSEEFEKRYGDNSYKRAYYIGVKLEKPKTFKGILGDVLNSAKDFLNQFNEMSALDVFKMSEKELSLFERIEQQMYQKITSRLNVRKLSTRETQHLIERPFALGEKSDNQLIEQTLFKEADTLQTDGSSVLRLANVKIDTKEDDRYLKISNGNKTTYVSLLSVSKMPYEVDALYNEYIYYSQSLDFPVDISERSEYMGNKVVVNMLNNKKKEIDDQENHATENATDSGLEVEENIQELRQMQAEMRKTKMPLLKTQFIFAVYANEVDELENRVSLLRDAYMDIDIQLERPRGDQFLLFNGLIPASKQLLPDYVQYCEPGKIASGMFGADKVLGDIDGFPVGTTGENNNLVYLNVEKAAKDDSTDTNSLSASFSGSTGGGKSFNSNSIIYVACLGGAKVLVFDPKQERGHWKEDLIFISDEVNIVTLSSEDEDIGKLDPWQLSTDVKKAESIAIDILTDLTGVSSNNRKDFPKITKAVREVSKEKESCLMKVVEYLLNADEVSKELGEHLESFSELDFARLLFGDGRQNQIDFDKQMNVIQIRDLQLPKESKKVENYKIKEHLSMAMMTSISALSKQFLYSDRSVLKIFYIDEAWALIRTNEGKDLMETIVREGRSMNAGLYIVTQNIDDLNHSVFRNNMGMKFAFKSDDEDEIKKILEYFNLKYTDENKEILSNLPNGSALFKDIYGNIGVIRFECLFEDLFKAFDTRPPEKEAV